MREVYSEYLEIIRIMESDLALNPHVHLLVGHSFLKGQEVTLP